MAVITVAELQASLDSYLERVKAGEEIVVAENDELVVRLVPVPRRGGPTQVELEAMYAAGVLVRPQRQPDAQFVEEFLAMPRGEDPQGLVLAALLEERDEGR